MHEAKRIDTEKGGSTPEEQTEGRIVAMNEKIKTSDASCGKWTKGGKQ